MFSAPYTERLGACKTSEVAESVDGKVDGGRGGSR